MKLEKAREIIDLNIKEASKKMPPDVKDALTLGSEAILFVERSRLGDIINPNSLLPGETED